MTCLDKYLEVKQEGRSRPFSLDKARAILLGYLFNAMDYSMLKERLTVMGVVVDRSWRHTLVADSRVLVEFKFPFYRALARAGADYAKSRESVMQEAIGFGLNESDLPLIDLACDHPGLNRHLPNLIQRFTPLSQEAFDREVTRTITKNAGNTRGFVFAKMRFLQRWGITIEDSILDCTSAAYESLLFQYPRFEGREHFDNVFKQAVRHQGLKKVEHYTAQSRSSFQVGGDYRMETLESYHEGEIAGTDHDLVVGAGIEDDAQVQVHQLLRSGYLSHQDKQAISLLVGNTDPEFDDWLSEQGESHLGVGDNARRLRRLVLRYLDYPESRLGHIRDMLSGDFKVAGREVTFDLPLLFR